MEVGAFVGEETAVQFEKYIKPLSEHGRLLEIGTGMGHSARYFSEMKPGWDIYTVDSFGLFGDGRIYKEWDSSKVKEVFEYLKGTSVIQILADSNSLHWELPLDVLYIDGGHYYDTVKKDFELFTPHLKSDGLLFMHDYQREDFGVKRVVSEALATGEWDQLFIGKVAVLRKK